MNIYKITNKINNKIYIGQTYKPINVRFKEHLKESNKIKSKHLICRAIKKYGKNNFTIELIDTAITKEELNAKEIYWIKQFNAKNKSVGYNLTDGGEGVYGYKHSKESKEKNRKWHLGKKLSETVKKKISMTLKKVMNTSNMKEKMSKITSGKNNPFYGKKHTIQNLKINSEKHKRKVAVYDKDMNLINIFDSRTVTAKYFNKSIQRISEYLYNKRNHKDGLIFKNI